MKKYGCHIILMFALLLASTAYGQERRTEMRVYFRVMHTAIDTSYMDNAAHLQEITSTLQNLQHISTTKITEVSFCGAASPEGSYELNRRLARERLSALESLVRKQVDIPDSIITRNDSYIPWRELKSQLEQSDIKGKEEAIAIIEEEPQMVNYHRGQRVDHRVVELQQLDGGSVWKQINKLFFNRLRNAYAIIVTYTEQLPPAQEAPTVLVSTQMKPAQLKPHPYPERPEEPEEPEEEQWRRLLHLKTNAIGWGLAISNFAVEVDLGKHWSFTLPVYYSAWDYFKETIKFRTLAIQPEFRYWFSIKNQCNDGWFIGAHFGLAQYNLATAGGDYRYQDYKRKTPALGGGLSLGYRLPISKNHRWRMEFALGGGVYSLHFDKYYNTGDTTDGLRVGDERKTYWGFDQAAVTFSYSFDLKKKGGK